jgi:hypothetical protein
MAAQRTLATDLGRKSIRFVIALIGLLILRAIPGSLSVLTNATAFEGSLVSPLVLVNVLVDTLIVLAILQFGLGVGRAIRTNSSRLRAVGTIISLATLSIAFAIGYRQYETPIACLVLSPADLPKAAQSGQPEAQLAQVFGQVLHAVVNVDVNTATGDTLAAFQHAAVIVLRQPPDLYGWISLALISLPLVGIVVLVSRNLDSFSEALFHAASASSWGLENGSIPRSEADLRGQCTNCGQTIDNAKFCPHCGTPSSAPTLVRAADRVCASCGSGLLPTAEFCRECGKAA